MRTLLPNPARQLPPIDDRPAHLYDEVGRALANSIALEPGKLWSVTADPGQARITCITGNIWITQTGDARDHLLAAGQSFLSSRAGGKIVVQAMTRANISIRRA